MALAHLLRPRAVAVIGAAREPGKVGHVVLANLLSGRFSGRIYPVNPRADKVLGLACYDSVRDAPPPVDLAVVAVPAQLVPGVIAECGQAGVGAAIVITAGFTESGPQGAALQRDVVERARQGGVRLLGPNCLGLVSTHVGLNASFAGSMPPAGGIAFVSQSGALGTAILDRAADDGLGVSHFISVGNRADISEPDLLGALENDPEATVIALYLESVADGPRFLEAARSAVRRKPVIALKAGASDSGARAVSSHTGSLAGSDVAYDAAFRHAGVIRARSVQDLFDFSAGFSLQPVVKGSGIAIVTNAGGPAVMATDAADEEGIALATFAPETLDLLRASLPDAAALYNPVDVLGDAGADRYHETLEALYPDPSVHAMVVILTPQAMTDPAAVARTVVAAAKKRPDVTTLACFMGGPLIHEAQRILAAGAIPTYPTPERAIHTLGAMGAYAAVASADPPVRRDTVAARVAVRTAVARAVGEGRTFLTEQSAADIVSTYGIRVPDGALAADRKTALEVAERIGYPVALKIVSPEILHKSDVGGLRVGIDSAAELEAAYDEVLDRARAYAPDAALEGVHIQRMVPPGREVIIGVDRDPVFGPLLMFGLGGIYVEVFKDVVFRLCPVDLAEAERMISEIRSFGLLRGARGEAKADLTEVAAAIEGVSSLVLDFPKIVELDINPLIVGDEGQGVWAADVRIGIGGT
ncbi:MAG: acetate--CoA ligase family protein [Anaerosomatales bacterium]|nr:acetate--CoA ligase family protein [Anaerosomatales bacterium]MDT8433419.1 acetate--CoA ligase family protein [Anaerosomatales bacterium]